MITWLGTGSRTIEIRADEVHAAVLLEALLLMRQDLEVQRMVRNLRAELDEYDDAEPVAR